MNYLWYIEPFAYPLCKNGQSLLLVDAFSTSSIAGYFSIDNVSTHTRYYYKYSLHCDIFMNAICYVSIA